MACVPSNVPGLKSATECLQNLGLELAVANELLERHGVTRLANLTGLDTIDVPVWSCIRPHSRSLAVSFGKGLTDGQAQVSAIMEAMESAFAEDREAIVSLSASIDELEAAGVETVPLQRLSRCRFEHVDRSARLGWVHGVSLSTASKVVAPFELVGLDYTKERGGSSAAYRMSSIGLAAGISWEAAVAHAVLELVEHDAVAIFESTPALADALPAERYRPGFSKRLDEAVERFKAVGIEPIFRTVSDQLGFPVVMCSIPRLSSTGTAGGKICGGFASRQSVEEAALAALLEAAQVRMTAIAGAREDLQWPDYEQATHFDPRANALMSRDASALFAVSPDKPQTNLSLQEVLERLGQAGIHNVYAFSLNRPDDPIQVVRVLAEGLDVADPESGMDLGQRAISALLKLTFANS